MNTLCFLRSSPKPRHLWELFLFGSLGGNPFLWRFLQLFRHFENLQSEGIRIFFIFIGRMINDLPSTQNDPEFTPQFEQYLLSIAATYIDQMDRRTQDGLIKLMLSMDREESTATSALLSVKKST